MNWRANGASVVYLEDMHYYPFGMQMEGIGTQNPANKYLYNCKERNEDLGLNWYAYGARFYDPAIGRFPGVDPIAEKFAWVSVYNYAENEPVANIDLHGLQKLRFQGLKELGQQAVGSTLGALAAMAEDITGFIDMPEASEAYLGSKGAEAFRNAEQFTHAGMIAIGGATATLGAGVATAGEALTVTVVGAEFGIPAAVAGTGMMLGGSWMAANAMRNMNKKDEPLEINISPEDKIDRNDLEPPSKHGNAPTFKKDGTSVEIHHKDQKREGPFKEMHWKDHRGKDNDSVNHPNKGGKSEVDRKEFDKAKKEYWKKEYPPKQ